MRFLAKQDRKHLKVSHTAQESSPWDFSLELVLLAAFSYRLPELAVLSLLAGPRGDLLTGCMCEHVWTCLSLTSRGLTYRRLKDLDFSSLKS